AFANTHGLQPPPIGTVCVGSVRTAQVGDAAPGAFRQIGICQRSLPGDADAESTEKRDCASVTDVRPFAQEDVTSTCGTPACSTNVPMMRSTGFPEAAAMALMKSSDVAFAYLYFSRYALTPFLNGSSPT